MYDEIFHRSASCADLLAKERQTLRWPVKYEASVVQRISSSSALEIGLEKCRSCWPPADVKEGWQRFMDGWIWNQAFESEEEEARASVQHPPEPTEEEWGNDDYAREIGLDD